MPSNNNIYKMSNAGGFKSLTRYHDMLAGNTTWNPWEPAGAYESIAVATMPSVGIASITFNSIPQTYAHLQVRYIGKRDNAFNTTSCSLFLNNDTGNNYTRHELYGDGSAMAVSTATAQSGININILTGTTPTNVFGVGIVDILDYTSTSKNKTVRALSGADTNGAGIITFASGLWSNTSAVTSVTFAVGSTFTQYSSFALYGIKG